jgi:acetylxylan esterase
MPRSRTKRWWLVGVGAALVAVVAVLGVTRLTGHDRAAAGLEHVTDFGANPGELGMYVYVPDGLPAKAPVLVGLHWCTGSGPTFYTNTAYAELARRYKFIVVYPDAHRPGQCFDVSSNEALQHDGGSDPTSIANMVRYVQKHWSTDPSRVFVTGLSSGAMMTEVMLADYPDLFAAGAVFAGVPAGCFATGVAPPGSSGQAGYNPQCAGGNTHHTAKEWGDIARAADPGYTGTRPRVMLYHGTKDTTLDHANLDAAIAQWTDVLGVSSTPAATDHPQTGWTRTRYGATDGQAPVEAVSEEGVTHDIQLDTDAVMRFFGLDQ